MEFSLQAVIFQPKDRTSNKKRRNSMNRFVKKLLAKYVKYIEIIGYALVFLFIAGLIALSKIKAEDEYVNLNGNYEFETFLIQFDTPKYIIDQLSDSNSVVQANDPLFEITDDERFIADQSILDNLEIQVETANKASRRDVADKLSSVILDIEKRKYKYLKLSTVRSKITGEFILVNLNKDFVPEHEIIGGVFDLKNSIIRVTEFPVDKRMKKKLKPDQAGTANLKLGLVESIDISITLDSLNNEEAVFHITEIPEDAKIKIARYISSFPGQTIQANVNVLVGWKSWMNLIWR